MKEFRLTMLIMVALFLFMSCIESSSAGDTEVGVLLHSYHADRDKNYNEKNYGAYVMHKNVFALIYENSYNDTSTMVGYRHKITNWFSLNIGIVYGYGIPDNVKYGIGDGGKYGRDLIPVIMPAISFHITDTVKINTYLLGTAVAVGIGVDL